MNWGGEEDDGVLRLPDESKHGRLDTAAGEERRHGGDRVSLGCAVARLTLAASRASPAASVLVSRARGRWCGCDSACLHHEEGACDL